MKIDINKINIIKAKRGLTNIDIAELTGISRAWLSTVFNKKEASPKFIYRLCKGLDIEVSEILLKE